MATVRMRAALAVLIASLGWGIAIAAPWQAIGPFGDNMLAVYTSPHLPTVAIATSVRSAYFSSDAGQTWIKTLDFEGGGGRRPTDNVIFDPASPERVYLVDYFARLYRSDDRGRTWTFIRRWIGANEYLDELTAFAVDPDDTDRLFAYVTYYGVPDWDSYRYESLDGGETWAATDLVRRCEYGESGVRAVAFTAGPKRRRIELVPEYPWAFDCFGPQYEAGAYAFDANGIELLAVLGTDPNPYQRPATRLVVDEDAWYAQIGSDLRRSTNQGVTWQMVRGDTIDAAHSGDLIVAVTPAGVVWSSDKGASWSTTAPIDPKPGSLLEAQSVAVSPSERFLVGTRAGMVHSNDRGASWTPANAGLLGLGIRAIEVAADGTVWAGAGETSMGLGILRTVDQGASWVRSDAAAIAAYIRDIRIDPVTENRPGGPRLFASGSSCVTSNCSQFAAGGSNSGIYVSEDGGLSWSVSGAGLPPSLAGVRIVRTLAIDPHGAASLHSNRLLAGTGAITGNWLVSRSVDAGQNWLPTTGLPNDEPPIESLISQVAFDPHVPGIAYASLVADVPSYAQPTGYQSGVFRSTDFGATWVLASAGLPRLQGWAQFHHGTYSIVVDRWRAGYLWATGAYGPVNDQQSPWAFRSVDGGNRWSACGPGLPAYSSPRRITQSNQNPNVLAIAAAPTEGGTGGVWVSYDGCASWTELGDPSPASATAIVVDGNTVYAGTSQGVQVTTLDADVVLADGFE